MESETERLIDLAIRPLEKNAELQLAVETELRNAVKVHAADSPGAITEAADSLARADQHPHRRRWRMALYLLTLFVPLPLFTTNAVRPFYHLSGIKSLISPTSARVPASWKPPKLSPAQSLLLNGNQQATNEADRWKSLWESDPNNPVYLAVYAGGYFRVHDKLSPEILATAERIDPDNGWFLAMAAAANADDAVKREKRSLKDTKDGKAAVITIRDEKLLKETLARLHQAALKPRLTSHQMDLLRLQLPLLPPRTDWASQIPLITHVASMLSPGIALRKLSDVLAAGAEQCAATGDVAGFHRIMDDWSALVRHSTEGGDTLVDLLVAKATMIFPAANFRDAAGKLGLKAEERYFSNLYERSVQEKKARELRRKSEDAQNEYLRKRGSILGGLVGPSSASQVQNPPTYTDQDMRPARYADHALFGRVFAGFGWTLLLIMLPFLVTGFRKNLSLALVSQRLTDLLHPWDWVRLIVGGVLFPVLWYLVITRLTPLSAREWSVTFLTFVPIAGQFGSLFLSLLILPRMIASRLLSKRAAVFGLAPRFPWLGWLAAATALAGVPAFGAVSFYDNSKSLMILPLMLPMCSVAAWILSGFGFGRPLHALRRATVCRIIFPAWVAGLLALALLVPFHYAEEQYWIPRDRIGEISMDSPSMSHFEYQVTQVLRSEILEMLGVPPVLP